MTPSRTRSSSSTDLLAGLDRWVGAGIITAEQAARIRANEHAPAAAGPPGPAARPQPASLVVEALGYLGGVLVVVATTLLTVRVWDDLPVGVRLALPALAAVLLLASGHQLRRPGDTASGRVRSALWALSVAALAAFVALLHQELVAAASGLDVAAVSASAAAAYAALLWAVERTFLQQATLFAALLVATGTGAAHLSPETLMGIAIWSLGVCWIGLGWRRWMAPQRLAYVLGSLGALFGAQITMADSYGNALAVVTAAGLVTLGVVLADLALLGVAALATLLLLPQAMTHYFPGALTAPLALLAGGLLLVGAALRTARHARTEGR